MSEAFSAIITTADRMFPETISGITEASTTRRLSTPITLEDKYKSYNQQGKFAQLKFLNFVKSAHPQMQLRSDTPHRLTNTFQLSAYD